jgi:hypothetical protein
MKLIIYNPDHHYSYIQACMISQTVNKINPSKCSLISCFNETEIINTINRNRIELIIQIIYGRNDNYLEKVDETLKVLIVNSPLYGFVINRDDTVVITKDTTYCDGIIFDLYSTTMDNYNDLDSTEYPTIDNNIRNTNYYWIGIALSEYDGYDLVKKFERENNVVVNKINLHDEKDSVVINSIITKLMNKGNIVFLINRNDNYALKYYCTISNVKYIILNKYERLDSLYIEDYIVEKILELN